MELPFHDLGSFYWWGFHVNIWISVVIIVLAIVLAVLNMIFKLDLFVADGGSRNNLGDEVEGIGLAFVIGTFLFAWPVVWALVIGVILTLCVMGAREIRSDKIREQAHQ